MHAYRERICLLQVSVPGHDVLIDPMAVDIAPLAPLFADPSIEKVMHGADYDILCFKREYGFAFAALFDTMLAARVLGWSGHGLGAILAERHGFLANKKMQRFDWGQRPLPEHALDYARYDTHFLLRLRQEQLAELTEAERLDDFVHTCERQTRVEPKPSKAQLLGMWRIKGVRDLSAEARALCSSLYDLRDEVAREIDRPVFRVMADAVLLGLARDPPADDRVLADIRGLHPRLRGRGRARVMAAIEAGRDAEPPRPPARDRGLSREPGLRMDKLRAWRKAVAAKRGLEPDIILGKDSLMAVAQANPADETALRATGALDDWEFGRYGAALLEVLAADR